MHAHQPMPAFPVETHVDSITRADRGQILVLEVVNDIVTIVGVTRVHHRVIAPIDG